MSSKVFISIQVISDYISDPPIRSKISHPLDYKLQIIEEAKISGSNRGTARKHGLSESQIRNWRKNENKIRDALLTGRLFRVEKSKIN